MNATKLHEALAEIEAEGQRLDAERIKVTNAADSIRAILVNLGASAEGPMARFVSDVPSYIDDSEELVRAAGQPLHAKVLAEKISEKRGVKVARSSVESSVIRHISKSKQPRLAKFGRSLFGLPEWKQQPTLAHIA
jgi:hypothetical protein